MNAAGGNVGEFSHGLFEFALVKGIIIHVKIMEKYASFRELHLKFLVTSNFRLSLHMIGR